MDAKTNQIENQPKPAITENPPMETETLASPAVVTSSCRKSVKDDNATFFANMKVRVSDFLDSSMDEHKTCLKDTMDKVSLTCLKDTMDKVFGRSKEAVAEKNVEAKEIAPLQAAVTAE